MMGSSAAIKRAFDIVLSAAGLLVTAPILLAAMALIYAVDFKGPIYVGVRAGKDGRTFRMYKLRSMIVGADRNQVDTTARGDSRITPIGGFLRSCKADELPQLWNVLKGDMSLVGPRPNVMREVEIYTAEEQKMLAVRPGITDLSSIVFSDLADRIGETLDPNLAYNQLIRPWKSRLSLLYVQHASLWLDIWIIALTMASVVNKPFVQRSSADLVERLGGDPRLPGIITGRSPLTPTPPPGATVVVTGRKSSIS
jgi:lipopolysaccharide/colanic/teichoic acid biosynthesis glycosyltransferase